MAKQEQYHCKAEVPFGFHAISIGRHTVYTCLIRAKNLNPRIIAKLMCGNYTKRGLYIESIQKSKTDFMFYIQYETTDEENHLFLMRRVMNAMKLHAHDNVDKKYAKYNIVQ